MVVFDDVHFTRNDKGFLVFFLTFSHSIAVLGVDKRLEFLDPIEDSLEKHPVSLFLLKDVGLSTYIFSESERDALPLFPVFVFYPQIVQKSRKSVGELRHEGSPGGSCHRH